MNSPQVAVPCHGFGGIGQPVGWAEGVMVGLLIAGRPMDQVELEAGYLASIRITLTARSSGTSRSLASQRKSGSMISDIRTPVS